ncbi:transferase hexapeptide repeat protein [Tolypothrix sp. NIES-4075]|uniref:transferase n=1 Tax=Tolypothrix sp. NIES-4075 TaxID=2005459 RepID=UPI000B5CCAE3|nr:transferase [Tolypothrix sp. NIES-4075]GAX39468.1 transferase hexapeptide repeat protein [Tolypothrix sp. NIES-4075]
MSVPPLRLDTNFNSHISGEVIVHPSAVIAPGVILQAATNSKIVIGPGVCIGMGSILQVSTGIIEIEAGVSLGAGFLMVGAGRIGVNACIGSATTVFNCSVEPGQVVAPGSVLGDTTVRVALPSPTEIDTKELEPSTTEPASVNVETRYIASLQNGTGKDKNNSQSQIPSPINSGKIESNEEEHLITEESALTTQDSETSSTDPNIFGTQIYGQGSVQRLLITLFPHRQSLSEPKSDDRSE